MLLQAACCRVKKSHVEDCDDVLTAEVIAAGLQQLQLQAEDSAVNTSAPNHRTRSRCAACKAVAELIITLCLGSA